MRLVTNPWALFAFARIEAPSLNMNKTTANRSVPRLPLVPRGRFEALVHLALGLAALVAVWHFQVAITRFVPSAPAFAERLRESPVAVVEGRLVWKPAVRKSPAQAEVPAVTNAPVLRGGGRSGISSAVSGR